MIVSALTQQLGHDFIEPLLLQRALTHRSHSQAHNERLEFLGDSVLNCVIAEQLYCAYPNLPEGDLSRLRSSLVNQQALFTLADQLQLGELLLLGAGEKKSGGNHRPSMLADAMEALIGAVFLDGGFDAARRVVQKLYVPLLNQDNLQTLGKDAKTQLQEYLQARKLNVPDYRVVEIQGKAHEQHFVVECAIVALHLTTRGEGTSRRLAEQAAAQGACIQLRGAA
jgi:ribonuclease-3